MDDWDSVTRIGSKARGGAAQRETTIKGKSALNAAQRSGAVVGTEKKFAAANVSSRQAYQALASIPSSPLFIHVSIHPPRYTTFKPPSIFTFQTNTDPQTGSNPEGQRLTKVDRADGPVATKKVPEEVAKALMQARNGLKNQKGATMTQKDLAAKANVDVQAVAALERTGADFPSMDVVLKLQKAANVRLTGANVGEPMLGPKKK